MYLENRNVKFICFEYRKSCFELRNKIMRFNFSENVTNYNFDDKFKLIIDLKILS